MEQTSEKTRNTGLTYGVIAGLIVVLISLVQYLGGIDMYFSPVGYVSYLVMITFAVLAALKTRKQNEGFLEFGQALKITFTVFALALLFQSVFIYVLFNFIDVPFKEAVSQETMVKAEQMLRKMGQSDSDIEKALESERNKDPFVLSRVLLGYAFSCIFVFIFCLLISLIVKRSKPKFDNI